ncbi:MAG: MATE family efflux transporter [Clostridia bacterium]
MNRLTKRKKNWTDPDLSLNKVVFILALPVMAQMFLQTLAQIVDMAMVGRLGQEAIAGVGISFRPVFVGMSIFLGLGTATTALVSRAIGAKRKKEAELAASQSLMVGLLLSLTIAIGVFFGAEQIALFMGAEGGVVDKSAIYLKGFSFGMVFSYTVILATACLRGAGDTKTPFYIGLISNIVNVIGNYLLIFGKFGFPELGILGAAIGTSVSYLVGFILLFIVLIRGTGGLHVTFKSLFKFEFEMIKRFFKIGIPSASERLVQSITMMLVTRIVAVLGTTALAIVTLSGNIEQLSFMPAIGFSVAAEALVGQNLGAKQPKRAEKSCYTAAKMAAALMSFMGLMFILFPEMFIRIYSSDPEIIAKGKIVMRVLGLAQLPQAISFVLGGGLRGAGDTPTTFKIGLFGNVLIRLGLTWLFVTQLQLGLWSVYAAVVVDWIVRSVILGKIFKQGKWKKIEV